MRCFSLILMRRRECYSKLLYYTLPITPLPPTFRPLILCTLLNFLLRFKNPLGEVRLGRMNYEDPRAVMHGPFMNWNHVDCFVARRDELSFTAEKSPTIMTGFMDLREKDRNMLFDKLGKGDKKASSSSKRKSEDDEDANGISENVTIGFIVKGKGQRK